MTTPGCISSLKEASAVLLSEVAIEGFEADDVFGRQVVVLLNVRGRVGFGVERQRIDSHRIVDSLRIHLQGVRRFETVDPVDAVVVVNERRCDRRIGVRLVEMP